MMKVSMDKKYKTRDGRDVRLLCTDATDEKYPVVGFRGESKKISMWSSTGCFYEENPGTPSDLIETKDTVEFWVNAYLDGGLYTYYTEEQAKSAANPHAIIKARRVVLEVD
jgi:hypothetical protein